MYMYVKRRHHFNEKDYAGRRFSDRVAARDWVTPTALDFAHG